MTVQDPTTPLPTLLDHIVTAAPEQAGVLTATVRDLSLAVEWQQLRPLVLPGTQWAVIVGRKRAGDPLRAVLPLPFHTNSLTPPELKSIFSALETLTVQSLPEPLPPLAATPEQLREELARRTVDKETEGHGDEETASELAPLAEAKTIAEELVFDKDTLYVAIGATDSTVVYYKLSRGIKKPADIPDE
ncbi:uncharacterized protein EHS24_009688 [Apiotrichum porosum]|uniref:tRNA-splicing endonuclease subunit Sen15 domain-containing protein n=1 Tax=Apiotrichum porosum TaxID=105984 RepID=A0A427XMS4_9TREE|nr:uncharacterized protein EHS24_009688 [Apiotrichum porosum]RSH80017.1 hypothetical protein EHS24_009688 [Apiotrichum porosum]